ncbi:hypothetical protein ABZP36_029234 [Zizania latifolia]
MGLLGRQSGMDSGNSGSLQSSSGGDDEFDSRCGGGVDSSPLSALLRQSVSASASASLSMVTTGFGGSFYGLQELASPPRQLPHMYQAAHQWSADLPTGGGAGAGASPSSSPSSPHGVQACAEQAGPGQQAVALPPRGSRKRTRPSQRAPTTVLTTDTSNFRAMVQEFTGIPSPPFATPPARSRFDHLFPAPSSLRSAATAGSPASLPPYLLRPFAQKLHTSHFAPFPSQSTSSPAPSNIAIATSTAAYASPSTAAATPGDRYQLESAPSSSLLGMQGHRGSYLSFQSHLGGDGKYTANPMFDAPGRDIAPPPTQSLQDSADFLGLTHGIMGTDADGAHMHSPRSRHNGHGAVDELSGVVGGASLTGSRGGCKKTTAYSSGAGAVHEAPRLERNAENTSADDAATTTSSSAAATATTAPMRTQGVDSWICTSE